MYQQIGEELSSTLSFSRPDQGFFDDRGREFLLITPGNFR